MTSQLQDGALINLVLAGQPDCFTLLMNRHLATVKKRIGSLVRNAAEAEDLLVGAHGVPLTMRSSG